MSVPAKIYVGDTVAWVDADVPAETTAVNVYFRTNTAGAGVVAMDILGVILEVGSIGCLWGLVFGKKPSVDIWLNGVVLTYLPLLWWVAPPMVMWFSCHE